MPLFEKPLARWDEPWAFSRRRSAEERKRHSPYFLPVLTLFLTMLIMAQAVLTGWAKGGLPPRAPLEWAGLFGASWLALTAVLYLAILIPRPERIWMRRRGIFFGKRTIPWKDLRGWAVESRDGYCVLRLIGQEIIPRDLGVPEKNWAAVEAVLLAHDLPRFDFLQREQPKKTKSSSTPLLIAIIAWMFLILTVTGCLIGIGRGEKHRLDRDLADLTVALDNFNETLLEAGAGRNARRELARSLDEAAPSGLMPHTKEFVLGGLFGSLFLMMGTILPISNWILLRHKRKNVHLSKLPRTWYWAGATTLLVIVSLWAAAMAFERKWETQELSRHQAALSQFQTTLKNLNSDVRARSQPVVILEQKRLAKLLTYTRLLVSGAGLIAFTFWILVMGTASQSYTLKYLQNDRSRPMSGADRRPTRT